MDAHGRQVGAMKRFAVASVFMGFAVSFVVTLTIGGLTGAISRQNWVTGHEGGFPLALVGLFALLGIIMTLVFDYVLSCQDAPDE